MPLPVRLALIQRGENAGIAVHARGDVGDGDAGLRRRLRSAGHRHHARLALDQQVVGLLLAVRPVGTVAGDVAYDDPRVSCGKRLGRQPQPPGRARHQVLHEHIGFRQ